MKNGSPRIVLCNGADWPHELACSGPLILEYQESTGKIAHVKLELPNFVLDVFHLPDRILDLLEIAAYVFCADRRTPRGPKNRVEYHSWSRMFHFVIKVRDFEFWNKSEVKKNSKNHFLSCPAINRTILPSNLDIRHLLLDCLMTKSS